MSKAAKYIIAIVILLIANLWLFTSGDQVTTSESRRYFDEQDLEGVSRFIFALPQDTVKLELTENGWVLNDQYLADQGFVNTLISILERVETGREIENWDGGKLGSVEVEFDFNSRYRFDIASNATKTKSYFVSDDIAMEVAVPGYRDNVVDIFMLHPDQWRDRTVIDGSWRTIQNLQVQNSLGEDFQISFSDKFFLINDKAPNDSSAVVDYLNQFEQFQANEMISKGRFPQMDSLSATEPFASVTIDDIKNEDAITLKIFPNMDGQAYHLLENDKGEHMVIDARRVTQILTNPDNLR